MPREHPTGMRLCSTVLVTPCRQGQRHLDFSALSEVLGCWRVGPQLRRVISAWPEAPFPSARPLGVLIESLSTHGIVAEYHKAETSPFTAHLCNSNCYTHVYPWAGCYQRKEISEWSSCLPPWQRRARTSWVFSWFWGRGAAKSFLTQWHSSTARKGKKEGKRKSTCFMLNLCCFYNSEVLTPGLAGCF